MLDDECKSRGPFNQLEVANLKNVDITLSFSSCNATCTPQADCRSFKHACYLLECDKL